MKFEIGPVTPNSMRHEWSFIDDDGRRIASGEGSYPECKAAIERFRQGVAVAKVVKVDADQDDGGDEAVEGLG